jgi:hypothetical protein
MFGTNDNNQNTNMPPPSDPAAGVPAALPPSPFMDNQPDSSVPALPSQPPPASHNDHELVGLKSQALNSLAPLVSHLDQTPEEKFKTTMMLIQASDNSNLVKQAYEAANQITDEKARAQALLDVVNEINYFTQKDKQA